MKLILGGYAQGKLGYAQRELAPLGARVYEGRLPGREEQAQEGETVIVNRLHVWVWECLAKGKEPEKELADFLKRCPGCILICDEIGNGIVPVEEKERAFRERMGRIQTCLARQAEEVIRVLCGIGQKLK